MMSNLPGGTVTFLFTDIEGSTRLLERLGAEYAAVLAEQREILRAAFLEWNGQEIDTQGDAFFVAFARASDALNAVADAQRGIAAHAWTEGVTVRVRMALHTGEPSIGATGYVGMDVHRVARICSVGHGGQVLVSQTTADLVQNNLPPGVTLRDLGEHHLKDLNRADHLFQLVLANLPSDFPPLKSLDVLPNNLPIQLTSFIGREREIEQIQVRLATTRLLTLTGVGGTGKTRLALQVGAEVLDEFQDGVWLVELAPLSDEDHVPRAIVTALNLREPPGQPLMDLLKEYLSRKELLLILDNCEHLIETCAQTADTLLHAAPYVKILATSREPLSIAGEASFPVPSLAHPLEALTSPETLSQYEAVRLFVERAGAAQPNFQVTNQNAPAVAQICYRLDGIPLALELAAARVRGMSVEQIASRLDDRFRLLTGGSRTALPRQRTLQAAIDWSYKLLSDPERILLRRLAVFAGSWTVEAAEFVCADDLLGSAAILDLLLHLVDKSLVVPGSATSEPRYKMLETIRQYGQEKSDDAGESAQMRARHLDYYVKFGELGEKGIRSAQRLYWTDEFEAENDNLRAALEYSLQHSVEQGLRLATAMHRFWTVRTNRIEGRAWLARLLAKSDDERNPFYVKALIGVGMFDRFMSDMVETVAGLERSVELAEKIEDKWYLAEALRVLASVHLLMGNVEKSEPLAARSVSLFRRTPYTWSLADALAWYGWSLMRNEKYADARTHLSESITLLGKSGDVWSCYTPLLVLGNIARYHGDYPAATQFYEQVTRLCRESGDTFGWAVGLRYLGDFARSQGDNSAAVQYYIESLALYPTSFDAGQATVNINLGFAEFHLGNLTSSKTRFVKSLAVASKLNDSESLANALNGCAGIAWRAGNITRAATLLGASNALVESSKVKLDPIDRAEYDAILSGVREQLDELTFASAWAKGSSLTRQEAIAYALEPASQREASEPPPATLQPTKQKLGGLSAREVEVTLRIVQGESNREIAEALVVSERTVETHVGNILNKLGLTKRAEIRKWAVEKGLSARQ